jgi:hypothetical protein
MVKPVNKKGVHVSLEMGLNQGVVSFIYCPRNSKIRQHERTGRALGEESFLDNLEMALMRQVKRLKPGRKRKSVSEK